MLTSPNPARRLRQPGSLSALQRAWPCLGAAILLLTACASTPAGPSVMAMPGAGKSWDQFRFDDYDCRRFALSASGGTTPDQARTESAVKSAAVGAGVGAVAGAAIGNRGQAAAEGAGIGLLIGAIAGAGAGEQSSYTLQQRYDAGYVQCMYAKGHKVPVSGRFEAPASPAAAAPPPPPPPGYPPPPPPR